MAMPPQFQAPQAVAASSNYGPPPNRIEVMRAVKFLMTDEQNWKSNLLFACLLNFVIPVVGPITLLGWQAEIAQRLVRGHAQPIPKFDFNDFTHYLQRGLIPFAVQLIVLLPLIFAWYLFMVVGMVLVGVLVGVIGIPEIAPIFIAFVGFVSYFSLIILMTVFLNAFTLRAELTEDFGKTLALGTVWRYCSATWKRSLGYGLLLGLIGTGLALLGMLALCIGLYVVVAALGFAQVHLRHQIYAAYLAEGHEPIPLKDAVTIPSEMAAAGGYAAPAGGSYGPPPGGSFGPPGGGYGPPGGGY